MMKRGLAAILLATLVLSLSAARQGSASTYTTLYSFCQSTSAPVCSSGSSPWSRLLQIGKDYYGTTAAGGSSNSVAYSGTLFRIGDGGAFKSLYSFCSRTFCDDGGTPGQYLARGPDGDIYGITKNDGGHQNAGTIFKVSPEGRFTLVYRLCSQKNCLDGFEATAVVFDKAGNLFATTNGGGQNREGTIFEITAAGKFRKLHDFCAGAACGDGVLPGALLLGADGNFYGTTKGGGAHQAGTVFKITPAGKFTTLYSFCALKTCADGEQPAQALVEGQEGDFYGVTLLGGANVQGTIFRLTPAGKLTTLYSFCAKAYCRDGSAPTGGLTVGPGHTFYGTAASGGEFYHGVLFSITASGQYGILHNFCAERGCFDGASPQAAPTLGPDGNLYGTASSGGDKDDVGTVYKMVP